MLSFLAGMVAGIVLMIMMIIVLDDNRRQH